MILSLSSNYVYLLHESNILKMTNDTNYSNSLLDKLINGRRKESSHLAHTFLSENKTITELYEEVIKPALYKVGILWEKNKISVATEHMATAITEGILNELYDSIYNGKNNDHRVVVACVENELHQVGIKMVADTFEAHGWESFFLGTGIPLNELIDFIKESKPKILAISLSVYYNYANLIKMLTKIKEEYPDLEILIGGQAFNYSEKDITNKFSNLKVIKNLYDLNKYIELKKQII